MDAELYTFWDGVMFYLLLFRYLIFGLFLILDIRWLTKWKDKPSLRIPAVVLGVALIAVAVWYIPVLF